MLFVMMSYRNGFVFLSGISAQTAFHIIGLLIIQLCDCSCMNDRARKKTTTNKQQTNTNDHREMGFTSTFMRLYGGGGGGG